MNILCDLGLPDLKQMGYEMLKSIFKVLEFTRGDASHLSQKRTFDCRGLLQSNNLLSLNIQPLGHLTPMKPGVCYTQTFR